MPSEHFPELAQHRRPLCELRRYLRPPDAPQGANAPGVEAQESKRLSLTQVYDPALVLVQPQIELREFLTEPPVHRLEQPVMPTMPIHEDHQIIGIPRVVHSRLWPFL